MTTLGTIRGKEWWRPEAYARAMPFLQKRMKIVSAIRHFFIEQDFLEVETPALQVSPGMEPHMCAFKTDLFEPFEGQGRALYLHTSPEFSMKKLLVAGLPRIFQISHVYRNKERSPLHHPEFSMLEWYRTGETYTAMMEDSLSIIRLALTAAGETMFRRGDVTCDPFREVEFISVAEAFHHYAGVDLLATMPDPLRPDRDALARAAEGAGIRCGDRDSWEDIYFRIMLEKIEPFLGMRQPTILRDYPISMAVLSRPKPDDERLAERFELYVCGVELCNAFSELTDPSVQRRRFEQDMALKEFLYGERYPVDEDFLDALAWGMPESAGNALGIDRLVMLATGAEMIDDVLWAPVSQ